ncbi:MAG: metallophosphoesterase [Oscillibacter sp.]|nr:metallophosphoesterase [Oscillibacter sp.]
MALYAIGDLHLSLSVNKSMEIFGPAWSRYVERIEEGLSCLRPEDTLVLDGDTSWGMTLEEAEADFRFLDRFPGRKLLVKGNHDYWWGTVSKMRRFFAEKGITTLDFIHNNSVPYGDSALCGTRGWFFEEERQPHNEKMLRREALRLETSLKAAGERPILCFLHYPPLYTGYECPEILNLLERYRVRRCCYGHLHGHAIRRRIEGQRGGAEFSLISADYLGFAPVKCAD